MAVVALIGTLDTKGEEVAFTRDCLRRAGAEVLVVDVGTAAPPSIPPDVSREEVAAAAGEDAASLARTGDRGRALAAMAAGLAELLPRLHREGWFQAVLALGGSGGTSVACAGMRALPLGLPKVMVSTLAGGDTSGFVGESDIVMVPSLVDLAGLNAVTREVLARAAAAVCGMADVRVPRGEDRPLIAASMFGNTTTAVSLARAVLEEAGYQVLVFHATGSGGRMMERMIASGRFAGVLDLTTTEWADELVGGVLTAGPHRLEAAARYGVPAVVAPGCLDMVNFWAPETVPERFSGRRLYRHNPNVTLLRTTPEECRRLGEILAEKLNASTAPVHLFLPLRGLSGIGEEGGPFHWPEADQALFDGLEAHLRPEIPVTRLDVPINDLSFGPAAARALLAMLPAARPPGG